MQTNYKNKGLLLLKKGQKGIVHALFSRFGLILLLLAVQVLILFGIFQWFEEFLPHVLGGTALFSLFMVIYLLNSSINPTAKITWLIVIMLLPVFGVLLFLYTQSDIGHRALKKRSLEIIDATRKSIPQSAEVMERFSVENPGAAALAHYIARSGCYPVFEHTAVTYFPLGEDKFEEMLKQLESAQHFIFMEYFIIDEGLMWGRILEILAKKASQGVDVRIMYDGACEFALLPHDYPKRLKALGIKCKMFAPVSPFVSTHYNYRDHRKILVIDGHTAFNGGINLADEYINEKKKFGHWKDTAIMLKGDAVRSLTILFLQMWNVSEKQPEFYGKYLVKKSEELKREFGYVIPYGDSPFDNENVGEEVYFHILNHAKKYVHIMTPYLILDNEMLTTLTRTAKSGIEVIIIMPHIPDKKYAFALAKTYYEELLEAGVQIYEYTPGFVHAKVFVSDDDTATVGTINLDYRSLYLHFECGVFIYHNRVVDDIERDFQHTLAKCHKVSVSEVKHRNFVNKACGQILRLVAPLM